MNDFLEQIRFFDLKIIQIVEKSRLTQKSLLGRVICAIARFSPIAMLAWIAWVGIYGYLNNDRQLMLAVPACIAAGFVSRFISGCVSRFVPRERPFSQLSLNPLIMHETSASFPSNHAAGGFALATALLQFSLTAGVLYLAWAAILAYSRIYVRLHFFSDVLAGAAIGTSVGSICGLMFYHLSSHLFYHLHF